MCPTLNTKVLLFRMAFLNGSESDMLHRPLVPSDLNLHKTLSKITLFK